ncbi:MAG: formyltetrahydrofolate deformylase [Bacteroidota bacterium]
MSNRAILLIHCPDQKGLISIITKFLWDRNANVVDLDEHADTELGVFFCRVEWEAEDGLDQKRLEEQFQAEIADRYEMIWKVYFTKDKTRMGLFVSKSNHCLYDILFRAQQKGWPFELPLIISNHESNQQIAERFDIPFFAFEVTPENRAEVEKQQIGLLQEYQVDFIVLARYMQILSPSFVKQFPNQIINIHHSFLPAFPGARPYHQAYERGVKIIGATSHYVTEDLDAGPIIEQDVVKISHKDEVADLVRKGQDLEKIVLSRAIWAHIHRKVLPYGNKTIIFD